MVYKKYIKRGGKTYGPYIYKSRKVNGKVITEYLGTHKEYKQRRSAYNRKGCENLQAGPQISGAKKANRKTNSKISRNIFLVLGLISILALVFVMNFLPTGKVSLLVEDSYLTGEQVTGELELSLMSGELIPASTKFLIDNSGEVSEFLLSDLLAQELITGDFYVEGASVFGKGQGYGFIGERKIYPEVSFELKLVKEAPKGVPPSTEQGGKESEQEEIEEVETPEEELVEPEEEIEEVEEEIEQEVVESEPEVSEEVEEIIEEEPEEAESSSLITGEVVGGNVIDGIVSKDNDFVYDLPEEWSAEVKKNSVKVRAPKGVPPVEGDINTGGKVNGEAISESEIDLVIESGQAIVSTEYFESVLGFGEEFVTDEESKLIIDLSQFDLIAQEGDLIISLVYDIEELAVVTKTISVEEETPEPPLGVPQINESGGNQTEPIVNQTQNETPLGVPPINESRGNVTINVTEPDVVGNVTLNETEPSLDVPLINESEGTNVTELIVNTTLSQYKAVIGRPTKWIKSVKVGNETVLSIGIPKKAINVTIKTGEEVASALNELQAYEVLVEQSDREEISQGGITGMVSLDLKNDKGFLTRFFEWLSEIGMTGNLILEEEIGESIVENNESKTVEVSEVMNLTEGEDVAVEYYTDAPVAVEDVLTNGKRITVSGDDEFGYEGILAYTLIEKQISINNPKEIKLHHIVNGSRTLVEFNFYDFDEDGFIDYVEWIVPHLSEQVYEIIYITKAEHLDSNRTLISDIYAEVQAQDGIWSETINNGEYVRVTFEEFLDNTKDITVYARSGCSQGEGFVVIDDVEVPCEIYQKKKRIDEIRRLLNEE